MTFRPMMFDFALQDQPTFLYRFAQLLIVFPSRAQSVQFVAEDG
jgi:hypothetical protein